MRQIPTCLAIALVCAGCSTQLTVSKVEAGRPETHVGIPHPLLYSRYELKLRWQVAACGATSVAVKVDAEFTPPVMVPDADNLFVIDPNSLSSPLKTSEVLVSYLPSGAPASLNAKVEDRSAQVLVGLTTLGASLAKFAAVPTPAAALLIPGVDVVAPGAKPSTVCSLTVAEAMGKLPANNQAVEAATVLMDARTSDLKAVTDKVVAMGAGVDEATKQALSKAIDALGLAKSELDRATKAQARTLALISYEQTTPWPLTSSQTGGEFELPVFVFQRWTNELVQPADRAKATVHVSLRARDRADAARQVDLPVRPEFGIPIRQGTEGRVSACREQPCANGGELIASRVDRILQLGEIYYLPCISRAFSSMSCSYSVDDNGRLKSMGSAFTNAAAETATTALSDSVKQATEARQTKRDATTKQLEAEAAYLKAKAARDAAEAALAESPLQGDKDATAALLAQAARLDAQRALIEAELALAEARAKAANKP